MKRRAEFLVCKRDGRREWLRAAKLARSITRALESAYGPDLDGHAFLLASAVLAALRRRHEVAAEVGRFAETASPGPCLTTADLAAAVERALYVSGRPEAAVRYAQARAERVRRDAWRGSDRLRGAPAGRVSGAGAMSLESTVSLEGAVSPEGTVSLEGPLGVRARATFDQN